MRIKWKLLFLALLIAIVAHATEVYICGWDQGTYDCKLISDPEPKTIFDPPIEFSCDDDDDSDGLLGVFK